MAGKKNQAVVAVISGLTNNQAEMAYFLICQIGDFSRFTKR